MPAWLRAPLAFFLSHLPAVLTLAALVGLFYVGNAYDWKLPSFASLWPWGAKPEGPDDPAEEGEVAALPIDEPAPKGPPQETPALKRVELSSAAAASKAGLRLARVQVRTMNQQVTAYGSLVYDQTRYAQLSTRAAGTVWRVDKQLGDPVRKGDVLALIEAAEVGKAKAEFLTSLVQVGLRTTTLQQMRSGAGSVPERLIRDAEASLREARIKQVNDQQALANLGLPIRAEDLKDLPDDRLAREVRLLGLPPHVIAAVDPSTVTANLLPLRTPFDGTVIGRNIVTGELASVGQPQFVVADVSRLWVLLDVRREDAGQLALGQEVTFVPDGQMENGEVAQGRLAWISPEVDEKTRTVRVRAEAINPQGRLRPNTFGNGRVLVRQRPNALTVPAEAVQTDGPSSLVFVRISDQVFEPRLVELGLRDDKGIEIVSGVQPGELVVTTGSHVLKTELFKGRIAEGD